MDSSYLKFTSFKQETSARYWSTSLLLLLIAADFSFISLEIFQRLGYASDPKLSLSTERGYAEIYQYIKFLWVTFILSWFALSKREAVYFVGAVLFFYFLLDDSLEIHEKYGGSIANLLDIQSIFGLRGQDYGELAVSALAGIFFLVTGWLAYRHSSSLARRIGFYLLAGVVMLAIFGVGVDMAHQSLKNLIPWANIPLLLLEDGGEMVVVSAISWFVYSSANQELSHLHVRSPV